MKWSSQAEKANGFFYGIPGIPHVYTHWATVLWQINKIKMASDTSETVPVVSQVLTYVSRAGSNIIVWIVWLMSGKLT